MSSPSKLHVPLRLSGVLIALTALAFSGSAQTLAHSGYGRKILAGYFEEWSIYYAGYNIANLQNNGVANKLTHLIYAFANVTPTSCAIADSWADYQSPYLPSVNGSPYTGPLYGNFAALQQLKALHPNLKVIISLGGASAENTANFSTAASTKRGGKRWPVPASVCSFRGRSRLEYRLRTCSTESILIGSSRQQAILEILLCCSPSSGRNWMD